MKPQTIQQVPPQIRCARDYENLAPRHIDAATLAYIAGGSGADNTARANRRAFDDYAVVPRALHNTPDGSLYVTLPGGDLSHPILLAPVALQRLVHPDGELATARGAEATSSCLVVSTLASQTLEEVAAHTSAPSWFQLYLQPTREQTLRLVRRAEAAGFAAIVVTLDAALQLPSHAAIAAGFSMPADVTPANLGPQSPATRPNPSLFHAYAANAVTASGLEWLLRQTRLPVWVKGVMHPDDAITLRDMGVAGVVVSNHGGRSLDGTPASLDMLPGLRTRLGDSYPMLFDGGIRSGGDVFKAIALGADAVLVGRLQVYALAVAGALGVAHLMKLLREELELHMAACGCSRIADIRNATLHRAYKGRQLTC